MFLKFVAFLLLIVSNLLASSPEGIPRELARQRASQIANVHYRLQFKLAPHTGSVAGHEELRFHLISSGSVLLDFREGMVSDLRINGSPAEVRAENGHIDLPADLLHTGENTVSMDFTVSAAPWGKAITRFEDKDDNSEYFYTLFVPMDAEMAFPCFDQPDLKGRFQLEMTAPDAWTVISNAAIEATSAAGTGQRTTIFVETRPISTYLFAFAAGPFRKVHDVPGLPGVYARQSKFKQAQEDAPELQQITVQATSYLARFFGQPFPFPKYDMVLIPGFAYGGMEHAGATFLSEEAIIFRAVPTHSDYIGRDLLLLHELTHQWFGDFTTMRWFDDLWLKEGFAEYMAYYALASLKSDENIWKRFYQAIKPGAYGIDSTKGTTPIYQDLANLKDAKSAYGAIVYSKAPGVLKQLAFILGEKNFRDGLRLYLKEHAYATAEWNDLVRALERVSGRLLRDWARMWIHRRGMPQVDVEWSCNGHNRIDHFRMMQHDVLNEGGVWPIAMQVMFSYGHGTRLNLHAELDSPEGELKEAVGKPCPQYVFANDQDYAYGRFLLDLRSRKRVMESLGRVSSVFQRAMLWGSLWTSVGEAQLDPRDLIDLTLHLLPSENDLVLAGSLIANISGSLHCYANPRVRAEFVPQAEALALERMLHSSTKDFRVMWLRSMLWVTESKEARAHLKDLLKGKLTVPGVELRPLDRWGIVGALIGLNDADASDLYEAEQKRDHTGDGQKYAYEVGSGRPDSKTKQRYFDEYLHGDSHPEDWIEGSLGAFNYWNQDDLTLPYLRPALEALPKMKRERKIFFALDWLFSFVGGQCSEVAQAQVHDFLNNTTLDDDLRLKVLQASDGLDRIVKIRQRYK
jgi:aminopeptidase N